MKTIGLALVLCLASQATVGYGWSAPSGLFSRKQTIFPPLRSPSLTARSASSAAAVSSEGEETTQLTPAQAKKQEATKLIKEEGGPLAFNTKYGALNPFAIYYGTTSILLGLPWYVVLTMLRLLYKITNNRVDKLRRLPIFFSQIWGISLLYLTNCTPQLENHESLMNFYKRNQAAMFVANHNSWMDIPFVGYTIGWRNYKLISKKELEKVPILGLAIRLGGHIMVDRSNRRSQLNTLKSGMQMLKDDVHLCTFPEGTRSRNGRLGPFKNGAFKMAFKAGAPVIPLSIVASGKAMPPNWMFPFRPCHGTCKVVIHEPIESEGKTEDELAEAVRKAIISGLPEDQRPLKS